ncbi:hypothetical protein ACS7SF_17125 [Ralstonia sp. 25C]|uniref:hypothetical protein n=1 Tax=Ralstonia sp. 25C TaxID=3447363 RepID=UPI003F750E69
MQNHHQSGAVATLRLFSGGVLCLGCLCWLFSSVGASFTTIVFAVFASLLVFFLAIAFQLISSCPTNIVGCISLALLWPCWWSVLTSIAIRQVNPETGVVPLRSVETWYSCASFKWLIELGLVALLAWVIRREARRHLIWFGRAFAVGRTESSAAGHSLE